MYFVGIASLIVAMGVTWMVTPATIRLGRYLGAVDLPGGRKIHLQPIPRIGGLAVFSGFLAGLAFAAIATGIVPSTLSRVRYRICSVPAGRSVQLQARLGMGSPRGVRVTVPTGGSFLTREW